MYTSRPTAAGAPASDATPAALGAADPGVSEEVSRADHVHAMPGAADVGAAEASHVHGVGALTGAANAFVLLNGDGIGEAFPPASHVFGFVSSETEAAARAAIGAASDAHGAAHNPDGADPIDEAVWATRDYVDATVGGLLYKDACVVAVHTPVASLDGEQTLDGEALVDGDRVLLTAQGLLSQNGPWVVRAGAWERAAATDYQACAAFPIHQGTYAGHIFYVASNDPLTPGVSAIAIAQLKVSVETTQIVDSGAAGRAIVQKATASEQRTHLELGGAALLEVGNSAGTVAAGDDARITGALQSASNLSDLADAATARGNLRVQDGPRVVPLAGYVATPNTVETRVGGGRIDPSDYAISGRTTGLTLEAVGRVVSGVTGTLRLYTAGGDLIASIAWTETAATYKTASVALPVAATVYELRLLKSGGGTDDDAILYGANVRITWS